MHGNYAYDGGAVHVGSDTTFMPAYLYFTGSTTLTNNQAFNRGGALSLIFTSETSFAGTTMLSGNAVVGITDVASGGAMHVKGRVVFESGSTTKMSNNAANIGLANGMRSLGGAMTIVYGFVVFESGSNTLLSGNTAQNGFGGAVAIIEGGLQFRAGSTTKMSGNAAIDYTEDGSNGEGGAVSILTGSAEFETGSTLEMSDNTAAKGGALAIRPAGYAVVHGNLCCTGNAASIVGGCAWIGGLLAIGQNGTVNVNDNTPFSIRVSPDGEVTCPDFFGTDAFWRKATNYTIVGSICAEQCNSAFTDTNTSVNTCDSCTYGWSQSICGCVSAHEPLLTVHHLCWQHLWCAICDDCILHEQANTAVEPSSYMIRGLNLN